MDVLTLVSTKGGCGKTTLTAHLAVEAERAGAGPVAVIDADPQASLARWWNSRAAETPAFIQTTLAELPQRLEELRAAGIRLVIIDTPGADVSHTRTIVRLTDLALIPSRPSPLDLRYVRHDGRHGRSRGQATHVRAQRGDRPHPDLHPGGDGALTARASGSDFCISVPTMPRP